MSDTDDLTAKFDNVGLSSQDYINILLLGCTGVGKSTFINSIANYLTFADLKTAESHDPNVLIPSKFTVKDKTGNFKQISIGKKDGNESLDTGESATQDVKAYVFPIWDGKTNVRIIDTPGMGDTRGIEKDDENSESILGFIAELTELHAICFLLKPNESRNTVYFKYCMTQILSRLDKSASKNILFVFTNTRGTDYGPGETLAVLKKTIDDIQKKPPYCEIPLNRNIFCLENEAFKYLTAVKKNVEFDASYSATMAISWKNSTEQCWKLIKYIVGDLKHPPLQPHMVQSTSAINEARRMITNLSRPLADISQLINQNLALLERHRRNLNIDQNSVEELKKKLYMPVINIVKTDLTQPVTICTAVSCSEVYKVGDRNNWHYKQRCHDPCYLKDIAKEIIGCPGLVRCAAMKNRECVKCGCSFSIHMHVYYMTKVKEDREIDINIQQSITNKDLVIQNAKRILNKTIQKMSELEEEHQTIITCCAKFAHFLQNNAITPYNDAYLEYIKYLIDRERGLGGACDMETVKYLQKLLSQYEEMKKSFDDALQLNMKLNRTLAVVTASEISDSIQKLFGLKHNGQKIKELYECQKTSRKKEFQNKEYVHRSKFVKSKPAEGKDKRDGKFNKGNSQPKKGNSTESRSRDPPPAYEEYDNQQSQYYRPSRNENRRSGSYDQRTRNNNPPAGNYNPQPTNNPYPHGFYPPPMPDPYQPYQQPYSLHPYPQQPGYNAAGANPQDRNSGYNINISLNPNELREQQHRGPYPPNYPPNNYNPPPYLPPQYQQGFGQNYFPSQAHSSREDQYGFQQGVNRNYNRTYNHRPDYNERGRYHDNGRGRRPTRGINRPQRSRRGGYTRNYIGSDDDSDGSHASRN